MNSIVIMSGSPFKVSTNIDDVSDVSVFDSYIRLTGRKSVFS